MAQQPSPDGRLVYLHCSSIFSGANAHVRKAKKKKSCSFLKSVRRPSKYLQKNSPCQPLPQLQEFSSADTSLETIAVSRRQSEDVPSLKTLFVCRHSLSEDAPSLETLFVFRHPSEDISGPKTFFVPGHLSQDTLRLKTRVSRQHISGNDLRLQTALLERPRGARCRSLDGGTSS